MSVLPTDQQVSIAFNCTATGRYLSIQRLVPPGTTQYYFLAFSEVEIFR